MAKLQDILDVDLLKKHVDDRLVNIQYHPTLPLRIYNYSQLAQFSNPWGDGTIDYCRGLIVDDKDEVIARPFKKFHNLNTASVPETLEENLPKTTPTITEKMDGSLGIYWSYQGEWGIATRGSFTSDQAKWATDWYRKGIGDRSLRLFKNKYCTPLFEIIYHQNRIVIDYRFEGLVMLSIVGIRLGSEWEHCDVQNIASKLGIRIVKQYKLKNLYDCIQENEKNREGYVVSYPTIFHNKPPIKVKIKFADYVRLHRIVTGVSPKAIWEILAGGKEFDSLKDCPAEFQEWFRKWKDKLCGDYDAILRRANRVYINRPVMGELNQKQYRAACASYFLREGKELSGVLFQMLDGRDVRDTIWKMIKPRGDDRSFRQDGE